MPKVNVVQRETQDIIRSTVNKAVNMVKPTYGPANNKVIISKVTHLMAIDDGVQIMRDLEFNDPNENAVLRVIRETAVRTNDRAGDGTTGSMIMLQAIMEAAYARPTISGEEIEKELKKGVEEAKKQLEAQAHPVKTKDELYKVARISFDDDKIADIIASTWYKMGKDGVITVDRSGTMETFASVTEGLTLNRGYISPYMITNPQTMEAVIEKPYILLTDYRLTETNDILPIMNKMAAKQIFNLVIICDNIENNALATAIINKAQGKFNVVAINIPTGDKQAVLEDIATMTGGKLFSEKKGNRLENAEIEDLGRADRFISRRTESVIVSPKAKKEIINKAVADLRIAHDQATDESVKKDLEKRIATFSNKVAVIKVGAATENEERALRYKVEDAVNAVQAAYKGGVVCGSGLALYRLETSSDILNEALKAPFKQLKLNMGITTHRELKDDEAINAVSGKIGKYLEVGVIDPVQVLIAGIESAVSIASILITSKGMIVEVPPQPKTE